MQSSNGVPTGWRSESFSDFATLQRGYDLPVQERNDGPITVYAANGAVGSHDVAAAEGPGVITGRSGTIGKVLFCESSFWPLNTALYVIDFHGNEPRYVCRFLQQFRLERFSTGTGVPTLNRNVVHKQQVAVPPVDEQVRIAEFLDTIDDAIERTREVIEQTRKLKGALLQDLLTNGLPGRHTEFVEDKKVGRYPADWRLMPLDDLVEDDRPICYGILMPGRGHPGGVPVVKVKDIRGGVIDESGLLLTTPELDEEYRRSRLRHGDLLMTIRGTTGRVAIVPESLDQANITQDSARISIADPARRDFVYYALQGHALHQLVQHYTIGQAVKGINIEEVRRLPIPMPDDEEVGVIVGLFHQVEDQLSQGRSNLIQLGHTKAALSQALLTGRVRLQPEEVVRG